MNKWDGMYEYKGFTIWCSGEDGCWNAEPKWSIEAIENYKSSSECLEHRTITGAKKWIREKGILLQEEDYLRK